MVYKNRLRIQYGLRITGILLTAGGGWIGFEQTRLLAIPVVTGLLLAVQIVMLIHIMEKPLRDLTRFFQAIEYSDFSLTFSHRFRDRAFSELNKSFDRVLQAFQKARAEKESQYRYLQTIVQHIGIGILVFKQDGTVDMINQAARRLFKLPQIRNIEVLKRLDPSLPQSIQNLNPGEKTQLQFLDPDSGDAVNLSVRAARFVMQSEPMTLISIQNIQTELEEKESEAWQNLIRVLTHEIMNSITPIASLASTANRLVEQIETSEDESETVDDVKQAIQTIESRSQGLLKFVESYRKVTRIPKPEFAIVSIQGLFDRVVPLMSSRMNEKGIHFHRQIDPETLEITADANLIEQVLINLLQNAVDWAGSRPGGEILLKAEMGNTGHPVISVSDNGPGIQKEALDKIFIPFFTMKKDGSGIGLSLSRQIMRMHSGTVTARSTPDVETVFTLRF